ncbi:hypothetical protein [Paenarthrobacter sp. TA1.8]|uniref:hypothetical protein n=1 Tax=Paenarthrobacter sp. TA1.8 TaxID=3400219 RepID=UPI003B42D3B9
MGLRNILNRVRRASAAQAPAAVVRAPMPEERKPLTPAELADVEEALVELRQAMDESRVTSFRACGRGGRHWSEDPDAMRAMAATFRSLKNHTDEATKDDPGL